MNSIIQPARVKALYAKAQFSLGNTYEDIGNLGEATTAWSNIRPEDDPEIYFEAQLNL